MPASMAKDFDKCSKIFNMIVTQPIFYQAYMERGKNIFGEFQTSNFIFIYCDPKLHGQDVYDKVMEATS